MIDTPRPCHGLTDGPSEEARDMSGVSHCLRI